MNEYGLYSDFDIEKHKKNFEHYLEVIIHPDGKVEYAVPSHQIKACRLAAAKLGLTERQVSDMCPPEYYGDYMNWLLGLTGCIAVWEGMWCGPSVTNRQIAVLKKMKLTGLYTGPIPRNF